MLIFVLSYLQNLSKNLLYVYLMSSIFGLCQLLKSVDNVSRCQRCRGRARDIGERGPFKLVVKIFIDDGTT